MEDEYIHPSERATEEQIERARKAIQALPEEERKRLIKFLEGDEEE